MDSSNRLTATGGTVKPAEIHRLVSVPLDSISSDDSTQARHGTDPGVIDDYASAMRDGATFPHVVLYRDRGGVIRVGDGFHRVAAARLVGLCSIEAEVRDGDARDALEHSIQSNARHGVRFNNADKRRVVGLMLDDSEWSQLSDREIARRCGVSQPFVGKIRAERRVSPTGDISGNDNGYRPPVDLAPADRVALAEATTIIQGEIASARKTLDAFLDVKNRLTQDQYRAWLDHEFEDTWLDHLDDLAFPLSSPADRKRLMEAYPGPILGDLPVGTLNPRLTYKATGRRETVAQIYPSSFSGYWFVSVFDLDSREVIGLKRGILESMLPLALHVSGFVFDSSPGSGWTTSPCEPASVNPDFATIAV